LAQNKYIKTEKGKLVTQKTNLRRRKKKTLWALSEKGRASLKRYMKTPNGRRCASIGSRNSVIAGRSKAYLAVRRAIKNGDISRLNKCSICGSEGITHMHHHLGYQGQNALKVVEICRPCHTLEHRSSNN
jgi:hypothetical protein